MWTVTPGTQRYYSFIYQPQHAKRSGASTHTIKTHLRVGSVSRGAERVNRNPSSNTSQLLFLTSTEIWASKRTTVFHLCNKLLSPTSLHTFQSAKFVLILLAFSLTAFLATSRLLGCSLICNQYIKGFVPQSQLGCNSLFQQVLSCGGQKCKCV